MISVRLVLTFFIASPVFAGTTPSAIALSAPAAPFIILGNSISFTAMVTPSAATGKVTFYNGETILGIKPLSNGQAVLTTTLLPSGANVLRAYYSGDSTYAASMSPIQTQVVDAQPANGFLPVVNYSVGGEPGTLAVGDFNGDGSPDLAVVNPNYNSYSGYVSVFLGSYNGVFSQPPTDNAVGNLPASVFVSDFNGDGNADLAIGDRSGAVSILLGNGNGAFQAPLVTQTVSGTGLTAVADFNGDGIADLLTADPQGYMYIMVGRGDGTFSPSGYVGPGMVSALVTDLNGDGNPDLVGYNSSYVLTVRMGTGDGGFAPPVTFGPGLLADSVAVGDFDGDGKPDIAFTGYFINGIAVMLGNGDGTFQPLVQYPGEGGLVSIVTGDFNGDGKVDLAATGDFPDIELFYGNGDGTFQAPIYQNAAQGLLAPVVADFNQDGRSDMVSVNGSVSVSLLLAQAEPCVASSSPPLYVDANGGPLTVPIVAAFGVQTCTWSATADSSWIGFTTASGTGGGDLGIAIGSNSTGMDQTGSVSVIVTGQAPASVSITQKSTGAVFADVPVPVYYFDAVNLLSAKGITSGCSTNPPDFCPASPVTRAEMAIFIVRSVYGGDDFTASQTPYFNDVGPGDFGFAWIQKMYELGITNGCGGGDFCPSEPVTRAEMAIFIIRARYGATANFDVNPTPYFTDVPPASFGYDWIQRMKMDNITAGCGSTTYCPNEAVGRGDMAIFVMRGGFNQLLPAGEPVISQISPSSIPLGQATTVTVTGVNTNFGAATIVNPIPGVAIGTVSVISPTSFNVVLTPASNAVVQPESIWVTTGSQEEVLPNALTFQ